MITKLRLFLKRVLKALTPTRKLIIFESNPDFSDNTYWIFKYIVESGAFDGYKFVWFAADYKKRRKTLCGAKITCVDNVGRSIFKKIRRVYYEYAAAVIIDCNRGIQKTKDKQVRVYLGHGMGIKKVLNYLRTVGDCDGYLTMGEGFRARYETVIKSPLIPLGFPRNEVLVGGTEATERYIVWMPTFRQHNIQKNVRMENKFPLGIPAIKSQDELDAVEKCLSECGLKLFIRPHPAQDLSVFKVKDGGAIGIADDAYLSSVGLNLYEFLSSSSALITDYSSVYYDYLLTERPIGLNFEDAEEYGAEWGLWYDDVRKSLPGHLIDDCAEMTDFIRKVALRDDEYLEKRRALVENYGIKALQSSELIVGFIKDKLKSNGVIK